MGKRGRQTKWRTELKKKEKTEFSIMALFIKSFLSAVTVNVTDNKLLFPLTPIHFTAAVMENVLFL